MLKLTRSWDAKIRQCLDGTWLSQTTPLFCFVSYSDEVIALVVFWVGADAVLQPHGGVSDGETPCFG